ncbi:hypothetical protein DFP73DRAFT_288210 [Morchella snyderi]|nr:hypothetical protein DFP73DRAFT_288210 [Morchella snyderi]
MSFLLQLFGRMRRYTYFYIYFLHFFVVSCFYEGLPAYDFSWEPFYFYFFLRKLVFIFMFRPHHIIPLLKYSFYFTYNTLNCTFFTLSISPTSTLCYVLFFKKFLLFVQRFFGKGMGEQEKKAG